MKVLLDTDIGSDIDDAVCLAYLLAKPECELMGITTVTGEAEKRAMLASVLCRAAGKNIPVYPGFEEPLTGMQKQRYAPQAAALDRWDHDSRFPRGQAVEFLRETIRKYPGEIILLTIGPLTNIGHLFRDYPWIPSFLKGIVMMCGAFYEPATRLDVVEWNAVCDPQAADIVYRAAISEHRSFGLNVTRKVTMDRDQFKEKFRHYLHRPVMDFAGSWFEKSQTVTFHDPLAGAAVFNDRICVLKRANVTVDLTEGETRGMTCWAPGESGKHQIAVEVDAQSFFQEYFPVFQVPES
ncbi:MAG: nucleoside hydrolase [Dehalococcoidales bacterium]|nr:nucleoside hydrolase [Dehalococcoidales bacterium]